MTMKKTKRPTKKDKKQFNDKRSSVELMKRLIKLSKQVSELPETSLMHYNGLGEIANICSTLIERDYCWYTESDNSIHIPTQWTNIHKLQAVNDDETCKISTATISTATTGVGDTTVFTTINVEQN